jgi:ribonuclease H / adenosylcobalamin/alpha-ribazole phosphatase
MEIFLVRHGETQGNIAHRHQSTDTPLTQHGRQQIMETANALKDLHPTHLLSSTVYRALESAQIIGLSLDMIPETSDVFRELERPVFLTGNFMKSASSLLFYAKWYLGISNHKKHGGESYKDLRNRVAAAQEVLARYPSDARVVVVSHSVFINFFIAHACDKRPLNPFQALYRFWYVLTIKNASITRITYQPTSVQKLCHWRVEK